MSLTNQVPPGTPWLVMESGYFSRGLQTDQCVFPPTKPGMQFLVWLVMGRVSTSSLRSLEKTFPKPGCCPWFSMDSGVCGFLVRKAQGPRITWISAHVPRDNRTFHKGWWLWVWRNLRLDFILSSNPSFVTSLDLSSLFHQRLLYMVVLRMNLNSSRKQRIMDETGDCGNSLHGFEFWPPHSTLWL